MKIFVLNTGLFPEKGVLEDALAQLGSDHEVSWHDAAAELTDDDWDRAVQALAASLREGGDYYKTMLIKSPLLTRHSEKRAVSMPTC